jgi:hypothetical protein
MQMVVGKNEHYAEVVRWKQAADMYKMIYNGNYFNDLFKVHKMVGLGKKIGSASVFCNLAAAKDKEVVIISKSLGAATTALYRVLRAFIDKMGVKSYNVGFYFEPLDGSWKGFPYIIRVVDRGSLTKKTADIGGLEMFGGHNVIEPDPYKVFKKL